jgi:hypothetical protein
MDTSEFNLAEVKRRVEEIQRHAQGVTTDCRGTLHAANLERELYHDLLKAIGEGRCPTPQACALGAIKARDLLR